MLASANFLLLLGVTPAQGRWFSDPENDRGGAPVAVVSHAFWRARLAGDPHAIGASIRVDGRPCTIIGVLPAGFGFRLSGEPPAIWLPAALDAGPRDAGNLRALARLRPGVSAAQAQSAMAALAADLKQRFRIGMGPHGEDGGYAIAVIPLRDELFGAARSTIYALLGASLLLLVLSFANTALLWIGRAAARRRDAVVRLALGAPQMWLRASSSWNLSCLPPPAPRWRCYWPWRLCAP